MSLLIDALKKAEEAKRRAAAGIDGEPSAGERPPRGAPEIDRMPPRPAAEPEASTPDPAALQDSVRAARSLFEVKTPRRSTSFPVAVGIFTLLALLLIGGYFWLQISPSGPRLVASTSLSPPPGATASRTGEAPRPPGPAPTEPAFDPPPAAGRPREPSGAIPSRGSFGGDRSEPAPPPPPPPRALPVVRKSTPPQVPAPLAAAWSAYRAGELERAGQLYRQVLGADRHNIDALNGLGAIAARQGRHQEAAELFRRTLNAQPGNPFALAGLSGLTADDGGENAEEISRLRSAVAEQPREAALHFALGNALASQQRWAEAQASYFDAYDLDRDNPDHLFNLAVSLDHLGRQALAARFYRDALAAAERKPHGFDPAAVQARLEDVGGSR